MPQIKPLDNFAVNRKESGSLRMRFLTTKFLKPKRSRFTCMKASKNEPRSVITTWHAA